MGATARVPRLRLEEHLREARRSESRLSRWISSLREAGRKPIFAVVESGNDEKMVTAERSWISHYRKSGARLLNSRPGGEGCPELITMEQLLAGLSYTGTVDDGWTEFGWENEY